jgi:hypothetical protein
MTNLMTATSFVKNEILEELKKGNTDVLKGLPPYMAMSLGMALQHEAGDVKDPSPIDDKAVGDAILNRMADSGVKEQLLKKIEQEDKDHARIVELVKQITAEINA